MAVAGTCADAVRQVCAAASTDGAVPLQSIAASNFAIMSMENVGPSWPSNRPWVIY
jgi:hypothetical protein